MTTQSGVINELNFHVNLSVFAKKKNQTNKKNNKKKQNKQTKTKQNIHIFVFFHTLLVKFVSICVGVLFLFHVCSGGAQPIFDVEGMLCYRKIRYSVLAAQRFLWAVRSEPYGPSRDLYKKKCKEKMAATSEPGKIDVLEPGWVRDSNNSPSEKITRTWIVNVYNSVVNEGHLSKSRYVRQLRIIYHNFSVKHLIFHFLLMYDVSYLYA